ncbi:N,N-dimethylformamidase beta subunit family domain-containing protein [Kribbella sp. NPDC051718]|uniref:N,N-dimethylformamidase beta subunit family domain-containing protein n=1 Tax=Kribbella sp. NPDC051718 TaxID=3155168 RepID=UPI003419463D
MTSSLLTAVAAVSANVTITASATTLTYRGTVTRAGVLRDIVMAVPPGSTGRITSVNGTVTTASPGVLRWRPVKPITVGVGARLAIPLYGVHLPRGGSWSLVFKATGTTGAVLSTGTGILGLQASIPPAAVRIIASNPVPGQTTTLTYTGTVGRAGVLGSVRMQLPAGASGAVTSINGTLATSGGYATWKPRTSLSVQAGARLSIPVNGLVLSKYGGILTLAMSASTSTGTTLMSGTTTLALIAPPAAMPAIPPGSMPGARAGCPASWPTTATENAKTGTADWVIPPAMNGALAAYLTQTSATCGDIVGLKMTSGDPVSIVAYRMGYYQGLGAREIWRQDGVPTVVQPDPVTGGTDNGHGVNVANLGANTAYRRITYTDDSRRAWDIDLYTAGYTSSTWRYLGDGYASQPLLGAEYICAVVGNTLTTGDGWLFDGVEQGTELPGFIAGEVDYVQPGLYQQPGQTTIASATGACRTSGQPAPMHVTTYTAPSGARVLNGSTFAYGCFLVARCPSNWSVPTPSPQSQQAVGAMVANIAEWVSRGELVVPIDTSLMRAAVPKQALATASQP